MVFSGGFDGENAVAVAEFDVVVFEEADLAEQTEAGAVHALRESAPCLETQAVADVDCDGRVICGVFRAPEPRRYRPRQGGEIQPERPRHSERKQTYIRTRVSQRQDIAVGAAG